MVMTRCRRCHEPAETLTRNVCRRCEPGRELVIWRTAAGYLELAPANARTVKRALLATGTRHCFHRLPEGADWPQPVTWQKGVAWLRTLNQNR